MLPEENISALKEYIEGWKAGDGIRIHAVMAENYAITTGLPGSAPVPKSDFVAFFESFRITAAEQGGPAVDDNHFMDIYGINRRQIDSQTVESGLFVVPGFGSGTYLVAAKDGKILFEDATFLPVTITGPE